MEVSEAGQPLSFPPLLLFPFLFLLLFPLLPLFPPSSSAFCFFFLHSPSLCDLPFLLASHLRPVL